MQKINEVCQYCTEKHCCRGLCKEMNEYLIKKKKEKSNNGHKKYTSELIRKEIKFIGILVIKQKNIIRMEKLL